MACGPDLLKEVGVVVHDFAASSIDALAEAGGFEQENADAKAAGGEEEDHAFGRGLELARRVGGSRDGLAQRAGYGVAEALQGGSEDVFFVAEVAVGAADAAVGRIGR
jgi:hypothetical protein